MDKDLKVSELASIWGASVPTTWNRIRKEGLTTFKKKDENNKEVTYVKVSEDILNSYINSSINNLNNNVNNGHYEDILTVENLNNNLKNTNIQPEQGFTKDDLKDIINTITTINNDNNDRLKTLTDELITYKSKTLLLEDKAGREGYYLNEISELKKENNRNKLYNKVLIIVIAVLLLFITGFITYNIAVNKSTVQVEEETEQVSDQVTVQVEPPAPQPKPVQKVVKNQVKKR